MEKIIKNYLDSGIEFERQDVENSAKVRFINIFSPFGIATLLVFGLVNLSTSNIAGIIELLFGVVLIANLIALRVFKNLDLAASLMIICVGVPLSFLLINGGIENTGIFWFSTFPIITFFLSKKKMGLIWTSLLLVIIVTELFLSQNKVIELAYSPVEVRQLIINYIVLSIIAFFYQDVRIKSQSIILKGSQELKETNLELTEKLKNLDESESKLSANNDELQKTKLAMLNVMEDLNEEKDALKELDKLKDEFLSVASHELRTPLTAIDGLASMIRDGEFGKVSKNLKQPLEDINTSSERLIHLVNDLLNLSRIQAGRLKYSLGDFDIKGAVEEVLNNLSPIAKPKKLKLVNKSAKIKVFADADKVRQILTNLVGNSLKFTDKGSITITTEKKGDLLIIRVIDTGIGIKKEDKERLFGKFQQLDTQKGRPAGTGLGLHLSREMVQKMGGSLTLERSEIDKGSTFTFTVPLSGSKIASNVKKEIEREAENHPNQKADLISKS